MNDNFIKGDITDNTLNEAGGQPVEYNDDNIIHLSDMEHVRTRPGMYIGRLGDGSMPEDGIYVLLKEVVDNSIDEFRMNAGKRIEIDVEENLRVVLFLIMRRQFGFAAIMQNSYWNIKVVRLV